MKYYIDSAEQLEIEKWDKYIWGATSNPSLLRKANITAEEFYQRNNKKVKDFFIQCNTLEHANFLLGNLSYTENLIIKVPLLITKDFNGFELLDKLVKMGIRTCATVVFDLHQFDFACKIGAEFSIVLIAKNENKDFMKQCTDLRFKEKYNIKTVAASFRTPYQVIDCIEDGADYATVPPIIMEQLFSNENVIKDYNKFYGIE